MRKMLLSVIDKGLMSKRIVLCDTTVIYPNLFYKFEGEINNKECHSDNAFMRWF